MPQKILLVEDDDNLRNTLVDNLELEGYQVFAFALVSEAQSFLNSTSVDLAILDVMLHDGNGYDLCEWIQQRQDLLVLMLTARNLEKDVIAGFVAGADDYVSKPYRSNELLMRIKALLKRMPATNKVDTTFLNGFHINWNLREICRDNFKIHMTKTAFDILNFLYQNLNQSCSREAILDAVWGRDVYIDNRTVDNFVSHLKKQLELVDGAEFQIKTIRGIGYSLTQSRI